MVAAMSLIAVPDQDSSRTVASPAGPKDQAVIEIARRARAVQPGELLLLTITTPRPASHVRVSAFDAEWTPFQIDDRTWRVLLGIDLDVAIAWPWMFVATVKAVRHALDFQSTSRTLAVCLVAAALSFGLAFLLGVFFGPTLS